jgi:DivIVA domain-containing protein
VSLDRQSIEKKDFPIGRRGYDPDAVDAHLKGLADELDEFKRSGRRKTGTLALSASDQIRAIVEAAETSAAEIQRQAEDEAREIREEAAGQAQTTREQASEQARDYVSKVSQSTTKMLERVDAMESELSALMESLRTGSTRLNADLQLLEDNLSDVGGAVSPGERFEPELQDAPEPMPKPAADASRHVEIDHGEGLAQTEFAASASNREDDTEGARLIALNMALNGTPRGETERYLADNFQLRDGQRLLDEVYASVEG